MIVTFYLSTVLPLIAEIKIGIMIVDLLRVYLAKSNQTSI